MTKERRVQVCAWSVSTVALLLALLTWGQRIGWDVSGLSVYQIFPLLGLTAFSLMWAHYIAAAVRQYADADKTVLARYFESTAAVVLAAIILHPGLLLWQLWRDGLGLPPGSYKLYVGAGAYWAVLIALIAWVCFMLYELRRVYGARSWWHFVQYASDIAMFLIFFHALKLGGNLQSGWYQKVWYFYGATLLLAIIYGYSRKIQVRKQSNRPL